METHLNYSIGTETHHYFLKQSQSIVSELAVLFSDLSKNRDTSSLEWRSTFEAVLKILGEKRHGIAMAARSDDVADFGDLRTRGTDGANRTPVTQFAYPEMHSRFYELAKNVLEAIKDAPEPPKTENGIYSADYSFLADPYRKNGFVSVTSASTDTLFQINPSKGLFSPGELILRTSTGSKTGEFLDFFHYLNDHLQSMRPDVKAKYISLLTGGTVRVFKLASIQVIAKKRVPMTELYFFSINEHSTASGVSEQTFGEFLENTNRLSGRAHAFILTVNHPAESRTAMAQGCDLGQTRFK